ncbi:uncharacterized protein LOC110180375 [Drosophila serrata]|uniref:uncharacterized protein LOC110180375 n=1 Tax=Drosophila serrata TaxID=7274 RepID=UPI000A1D2061|nr:uncharacterized protein LOC110180375 [Drosophila serrata]KAH8258029.1 hypothetical protein KR038_004871 [Drosophila bunnanda]KAH8389219.1 hypothetical protein KR200_001606 [Drosophila serrata]
MYNAGYQVDVIDPYYQPPVEVINVVGPPPPVEVIVPSPVYTQPVVVVEQPSYNQPGPPAGPSDAECCMLLGACCVLEECGLCAIM